MAGPYKRVLLKLSGEFLQGKSKVFDERILEGLALQLKSLQEDGFQLGIVVGGGNIFRGARSTLGFNFDRCSADRVGMVATVVNALALQALLTQFKIANEIYGSFSVGNFIKPFDGKSVVQDLENGKVLIFSGGTSHPFFSTDTAAALRACEIEAEVLLKGTNVDGVYSQDPKRHSNAIRFEKLTYHDALVGNYQVMDACAFALCREKSMPIFIFNILDKNAIIDAVKGEIKGTLITG